MASEHTMLFAFLSSTVGEAGSLLPVMMRAQRTQLVDVVIIM